MLPQCVNKTITESPNKLENLLDLANPPSTLREFVGQPQISCSTDDFTRERSQDLQRVFRNFDPSLLKQEKVVEYVRVLNAAKLDKVFAGPFIGAMDGHIDSISCMVKNPNYLKRIFSGSMDGDIRLWGYSFQANSLSVSWSLRCCTGFDWIHRWTYSCIMWN